MRRAITLALIGLLLVFRAAAQDDARQVFLISGSQLTFIDLMTGDAHNVAVTGDRFTLVNGSVTFFDQASRRVMVADPNGRLSPHPFIQPGAGVSRVDWGVSHDEQMIAWTETSGDPSALTTITWIAESTARTSTRCSRTVPATASAPTRSPSTRMNRCCTWIISPTPLAT